MGSIPMLHLFSCPVLRNRLGRVVWDIPDRIKKKLSEYLNKNIYDKIKISTEITRELQENSFGNELKSIDNVLTSQSDWINNRCRRGM